jgi:hypothetical protein
MKRLWETLFDPLNMAIVLPTIFMNLGFQIFDLVTKYRVDYFILRGLVTVSYLAAVFVSWRSSRPGESEE